MKTFKNTHRRSNTIQKYRQKVLEELEERNMKILSKTNKFYPKRLLNIHNPPSKLYIEGNYKLLNSNSIAIVGTRKCTEYGKKYSAKFAKELSQKECVL